MKVSFVAIRNFRRLEDVQFSLEPDHTVLVGPNNSGKTSAAAAFRLFFKRNDFTINDFTVSSIRSLDLFGEQENGSADLLPTIELDVWLDINPDIEFGRVFSLLPDHLDSYDRVGVRLRYCARDPIGLKSEYSATFPARKDAKSRKPLSHFLSLPNKLSRHFEMRFFALEGQEDSTKEIEIDADEGRRIVHSLIRVDFIDAQRNIHDQEGGRQNRLSAAFAAYYKFNLEKPADNEEANRVIDENNTNLTSHYESHFKPLLKTIAKLGVPSAHDRTLRLVSSLSAQEALRGSTELYYVDSALQHELPEAYNGLGFKNLVYMAIQVSHFHAQWLTTEKNRELCQLIFIEEPEVHLHAQVQQIFIANIWNIQKETAQAAGEAHVAPQLAISTHSSHIVDTVDFEKVRYFRRCRARNQPAQLGGVLNATEVLNLKNFSPSLESPPVVAEAEKEGLSARELQVLRSKKRRHDSQSTMDFLKKYLKLTHCDLFFADAAILVEGAVEKLLTSRMIELSAPGLKNRYVTILEVGGAYAHKLSSLLNYLGIPYLVVTDIDTVDAADARKACPAWTSDSNTSNAAIKFLLGKKTRAELVEMRPEEQIVASGSCFVAFQRPIAVRFAEQEYKMHGRTIEETFVYENLSLFKSGELSFSVDLAPLNEPDELKTVVYSEVREQNFKKTEFALGVLSSTAAWRVPQYIREGLSWLEGKLTPSPVAIGGTYGDTGAQK